MDEKMELEVELRSEHIKAGERGSYSGCPVAYALAEVDGVSGAAVSLRGRFKVWFSPPEDRLPDPAPVSPWHGRSRAVERLVESFDAGAAIQPQRLSVEVHRTRARLEVGDDG